MSNEKAIVTQGQDAVFPAAELTKRMDAARKELAAREIDVYIVTGTGESFISLVSKPLATTHSRHCCYRWRVNRGL